MFRTIYFKKEIFELIKKYAEENNITFNKSVNNIIEEFLKCQKNYQKKNK